MTQLEALKIAYNELSNMMPYEGENDEVFEATNIIEKMIQVKKKKAYKNNKKINKEVNKIENWMKKSII